jgi:hypothetical protein
MSRLEKQLGLTEDMRRLTISAWNQWGEIFGLTPEQTLVLMDMALQNQSGQSALPPGFSWMKTGATYHRMGSPKVWAARLLNNMPEPPKGVHARKVIFHGEGIGFAYHIEGFNPGNPDWNTLSQEVLEWLLTEFGTSDIIYDEHGASYVTDRDIPIGQIEALLEEQEEEYDQAVDDLLDEFGRR